MSTFLQVEFCSQHAQDGMVNLTSRKCGQEGCSKHPFYGNESTGKMEFCAQHASPGMTNLASRKCAYDGCSKQRLFGREGTKKVMVF